MKYLRILICLLLLNPTYLEAKPSPEYLIVETDTYQYAFSVEIASTPTEQRIGLMHREELGPYQGMLFVYDRPQPVYMWMRNTPLSLDMIFVDRNGKIVHIEENAEPFSDEPRGPGTPVSAVLEVKGGTVEALDIEKGDQLKHSFFK
jgi:uncharacterized membrane protein (UPF0127 family)